MDAAADLMSVLAEWRKLTERETQAILNDDWENVAEQQQRKAQLREAINRAREWAGAARATGERSGSGWEDKLKAVVTELVALETRNRDVLSAKRQGWQAELERVNVTVRNLRGVRRTYGGVHSHRWHSYS
jgi:Tfp pilus assembly protein PilV